MALENLKHILKQHGQTHLFPFVDRMTADELVAFENAVRKIDFRMLDVSESANARGKIEPIEACTLAKRALARTENATAGRALLESGKVVAVMLAGGQGTRLGSDQPKGCYNVGLTHEHSLFQFHVEKLLVVERTYGVKVPLYVMTSDKNHEDTVAFFEAHNYWGYGKENVGFFRQKMAPCTDFNRKLLMETPTTLATSPNGNGGWYISLLESECGADMRARGACYISLFGVDNPLQSYCNEEFLGAAVRSNADCTVKVVRKAYPEELMGVMCLENGKPSMIAYAEMTDEHRYAKDENGELLYTYGDILNMVFRIDALDRCIAAEMPIHIARKKIPYVDANGTLCKPESPNGFKYEQFLFDVFPHMNSVFLYEVEREREFAPIKNLTGADSVESARALLERNGVTL